MLQIKVEYGDTEVTGLQVIYFKYFKNKANCSTSYSFETKTKRI